MSHYQLTTTAPSEGVLELTRAVLLYRDRASGATHATIHKIEHTATGPTILPGVAARLRSSRALARALQIGDEPRFIPQELLFRDERVTIWWAPPARRRVMFRCAALGVPEWVEEVPHPGLVFAAIQGSDWKVWAVDCATRPTPDTPLYRAPYFNVWKAGRICVGNVVLPCGDPAEQIAAWNRAFFDSWFTHPNDPKGLVKYRGGPVAFWRAMLKRRFRHEFPVRVLVPLNETLSNLLPRSRHA